MNMQEIISVVGMSIAERGLDYFKQDKVKALEQNKLTWFAEVEGTVTYYVELVFNKQGGLYRAYCSCPCEFYCKHIVAAWLAVKEDEFVRLNTTVAHSDGEQCIKDLRNVCNRYAKGCDYWQSHHCADELQPFLEELDNLSPENQFKLLKTFYDRLTTIMLRSDDSDGLLGGLLEESMVQMNRLYLKTKNMQIRRQIERAWKKWIDNQEDFWLAHNYGVVDFWRNALCRSHRAQEVLEWVMSYEQSVDDKYGRRQAAVWHYETLQYLDEQKASDFLYEHLNIPDLLHIAVQQCMHAENYDKAECLLQNALDSDPLPGDEKQWRKLLLEIAERTHQSKKAMQQAEILFLMSYDEQQLPYYQSLKSACPPEQWQEYANKIVDYLSEQRLEGKLANFFMLEKDLLKLKALLLASQNILLIENYSSKIPTAEREAVIFHWLSLLELSMKNLSARKYYATWVSNANKLLKKYPYIRNELIQVQQRFRQVYKQRKALMEELEALNV